MSKFDAAIKVLNEWLPGQPQEDAYFNKYMCPKITSVRSAIRVLVALNTEIETECSNCHGCGTIVVWKDGGTCGQVKVTEVCSRCYGTGREEK